MNLKEVYLRVRKGQKVADVKDEFSAFVENYSKKKQLLDGLRDGEISEDDFRKKFKPLLDIDDVLLSIEQKLIKRFPDNDTLEMDIGLLKATIERQKKIMNYPAHVPLRVDQLRAAVTRQAYAIIEEEEHKRDELERESDKPLPEKKEETKQAEPEETPTGWQYPAGLFVDDPWLKPQAAYELFKEIIWDIFRLHTQKYEDQLLRGSVQAWADKHIIAPFPDLESFVSTLEMLTSKSKRHVQVLSNIILELKYMPDPFTLKDPSTKKVLFIERWDKIRKEMKKLPVELQAFLKPPADIISEFSQFLFTTKPGEDVEPLMATPVEIPEGASLTSIWSPPTVWFETAPTPIRERVVAIRAAYFLFLVSDNVVRLIDDLNDQPQIIEELASNELAIPEPGALGRVLVRIARDQKHNRKTWALLAALSPSLWRTLDKLSFPVGYFTKNKLRKQEATLEKIWDLLPPDVHEFLQEPVSAIQSMLVSAGVRSRAA